jgi:hypothetical protein
MVRPEVRGLGKRSGIWERLKFILLKYFVQEIGKITGLPGGILANRRKNRKESEVIFYDVNQ